MGADISSYIEQANQALSPRPPQQAQEAQGAPSIDPIVESVNSALSGGQDKTSFTSPYIKDANEALASHPSDQDQEASGYLDEPWYTKAWNWLWKPLFNVNEKREGGFTGAAEDIVSGFTSPASIALTVGTLGGSALEELGAEFFGNLGLSAAGAKLATNVARGTMETGFTAMQVKGFAQSSSLFLDALKDGDTEQAKYYATQGAASLAGTMLAAHQLSKTASAAGAWARGHAPGFIKPTEEFASAEALNRDRYASVLKSHQENLDFAQNLRAQFDEITADASDKDRTILLGAMTRAREFAPEDRALKAEQAAASDKVSAESKAKWTRAANLSPDEEAFVATIARAFNQNFLDMEAAGLHVNFAEHYITRLWNQEEAAEPLLQEMNLGGFRTGAAFLKKRIYQNILEGEMNGHTLATDDPIELVARQRDIIAQIQHNRAFLENLRDVRGTDGRPAAALFGMAREIGDEGAKKKFLLFPEQLTDPFIKDAEVKALQASGDLDKFLQDGSIRETVIKTGAKAGQKAFMWDGSNYAHVEHRAFRNWSFVKPTENGPMFMETDLRVHPQYEGWVKDRLGIGTHPGPLMKAALRVSSEAKASVFALSPMHMITTAFTSALTRVDPFKTGPVDITEPVLFDGLRHGLRFASFGHSLRDFAAEPTEGLSAARGTLVRKIPVVGPAAEWMHNRLWEYVNRQKAEGFKALVNRYQNANPDWTYDKVLTKAAEDTNNRYGIQEPHVLGNSATTRQAMRIGFLAPDWLVSRIRMAASALGSEGGIVRSDIARFAGYMWLGTRAANMMLSGQPHWEQPWGVVIPGAKGKDDIVLSVRTLMGDVSHAITEPKQFLEYRANPLLRTGMEMYFGHNRLLPQDVAGEFLKSVAPLQLTNLLDRRDLSPTIKQKILLGAYSSMGTVYPSKTEAERLAQQYAYSNTPDGPVPEDQIERHVQNMQLLDGLRNGTLTQADVFRAAGSPQAARMLVADSKLTPLQAYFKRLPISQALDVWMLSMGTERAQISKMLWQKRQNWIAAHPKAYERQALSVWSKMQETFPDL